MRQMEKEAIIARALARLASSGPIRSMSSAVVNRAPSLGPVRDVASRAVKSVANAPKAVPVEKVRDLTVKSVKTLANSPPSEPFRPVRDTFKALWKPKVRGYDIPVGRATPVVASALVAKDLSHDPQRRKEIADSVRTVADDVKSVGKIGWSGLRHGNEVDKEVTKNIARSIGPAAYNALRRKLIKPGLPSSLGVQPWATSKILSVVGKQLPKAELPDYGKRVRSAPLSLLSDVPSSESLQAVLRNRTRLTKLVGDTLESEFRDAVADPGAQLKKLKALSTRLMSRRKAVEDKAPRRNYAEDYLPPW